MQHEHLSSERMDVLDPHFDPLSHRRFAEVVFAIFLTVFVALAWSPSYREDWLLENALVFLLIPFFVTTYRRLPLSKISYVCLLLFLCLHEIGSHYTYSEVPYDALFESLLGRGLNESIGWERNHFDRVVHFLYGVLITYPVREIFLRVANARGFWGYLFPVLVVMSSSLLFELIEWAAALMFGGDLGMAYLGTQGDIWDSHKDSSLATAGALLASIVIAALHAGLDRDFTREWVESLRVKRPTPLGEVAVERMWEERDSVVEHD
jgi:putative membrane protein